MRVEGSFNELSMEGFGPGPALKSSSMTVRDCQFRMVILTLGVRKMRMGHLGLTIGFPLLAAFCILFISATAQSKEAARSLSIFSSSSTKRT